MSKQYVAKALIKFLILAFLFIAIPTFFTYMYYILKEGRPPRISTVQPSFYGKDLVILPYSIKKYAGYGNVIEPEIKIRVKGTDGRITKINFLLDSGAVVSTLPVNYADLFGNDLKDAKRIVLRGFGNKRTFGYMSEITILIKDKELKIPLVFSEGENTKKILGRHGFFNNYTIIFDHKDQVVRISQ